MLDAAVSVFVSLLVAGSGVRVLATSRVPLGIAGEVVRLGAPLDAVAAVELFTARVGALDARRGADLPGTGRDPVGAGVPGCASTDGPARAVILEGYADWLCASGDPRGALTALDDAAASRGAIPNSDPAVVALRRRWAGELTLDGCGADCRDVPVRTGEVSSVSVTSVVKCVPRSRSKIRLSPAGTSGIRSPGGSPGASGSSR